MKTGKKTQTKQLFICWQEVAGRFSSSVLLEQFVLKTQKRPSVFSRGNNLCVTFRQTHQD